MIHCSFTRCISLIVGLTILPCLALAQDTSIPNHSFEDWTGTEPDGWFTSNHPELDPTLINITQTTRAQDGMYAVRGEVATVSVLGTPTAYGPQVQSYDFEDILGFPIADRPTNLTGYFIYEPVTDAEYLSINVTVTKYLGNGDRMVVGTGGRLIANTFALDTVYTQFEATINYYFPDLPDTISISVGIQPSSGSVGSVFYVDNLVLDPSGVTSAGEGRSAVPSETYALQQNYPNPFNPSTTIRYSLPTSGFTSLRVYDLVGKEVASLVNEEQSAGDYAVEFNAAGQTSGVYYYRLQVGSFIQTRRMLLLR